MTLKKSDDWTNLVEKKENNLIEDDTAGDVKHVIKVSANSGAAVSFPITPSKLGNIPIEVHAQTTTSSDGVRRTLLVEVRVVIDWRRRDFHSLRNFLPVSMVDDMFTNFYDSKAKKELMGLGQV